METPDTRISNAQLAAQPVEETPRTCKHDKRFGGVFGLPREDNGCLACALERTERQLQLAQTENVGHIRIEDELKAALELAQRAINGALHVANEERARCAGLEKDADEFRRKLSEIENAK